MIIKTILNNSALISSDSNQNDIVLIGKGISFGKHPGDEVDESKIERVFKHDDAIVEAAKQDYHNQILKESQETGKPVPMIELNRHFKAPDICPIQKPSDVADTVAIYVLGREAGEGEDRRYSKGDYLLTDEEFKQISNMTDYYEKSIVLLNTSGVVEVAPLVALEGINAIVNVGQLGSETGHIVADMLTGKSTPSGKLTATWPKFMRIIHRKQPMAVRMAIWMMSIILKESLSVTAILIYSVWSHSTHLGTDFLILPFLIRPYLFAKREIRLSLTVWWKILVSNLLVRKPCNSI